MLIPPRPVSNLTLQALMFFDFYFSGIYLILALVIYIYKGATLFYPPNTMPAEVAGIFIMLILQYTRLHIGTEYSGSIANKTESRSASLWLVGLGIPMLIFNIFYLAFQTFVFWADLINNLFFLFFLGIETIFGIICWNTFRKAHP